MQLITMSAADLQGIVREAVKAEMVLFLKKFSSKKADCDILTRKETAILLRIDLSTLWEWTKAGKIKSHGIQRRVYYKRSEIENCLINKN
jgi:hypothetical protein